MNFAFVTVLLLLISLPGIAIRRSYYASRFSLHGVSTSILNELIWSFIPAMFLHAAAILIIEYYTNFSFHLNYFGYLLLGGNDKTEIQIIFENIHSNIRVIVLYFVLLSLVAIILGNSLRGIVRLFGLDIFVRFLRFPNRWHYIFTGEYLDIEKGFKFHKQVDFITVDVLMEINDKTIIYSGILEDYYLSKSSGGLERIIIKYPSKKEFTPDGESDYRDIPGNYLSIAYEKISNINIQYFSLNDIAEEENETTSCYKPII